MPELINIQLKILLWSHGSSGGLAIWNTGSFPGGPLYNVGRPFP